MNLYIMLSSNPKIIKKWNKRHFTTKLNCWKKLSKQKVYNQYSDLKLSWKVGLYAKYAVVHTLYFRGLAEHWTTRCAYRVPQISQQSWTDFKMIKEILNRTNGCWEEWEHFAKEFLLSVGVLPYELLKLPCQWRKISKSSIKYLRQDQIMYRVGLRQ